MGEQGPSLATVLFTDLVGSTELRSRIGEEAADVLRKIHDDLLGERVAAHNGRVLKSTGDGLMAVFASASDAVSAAVAAQQALAAHGRRPGAETLSVRMGLSVGDVSWDDGDCFGLPLVEAARLEAAADGGQILCSDYVRVMARGRGGHRFTDVGPLDLKGLSEPLATCRVEWEPLPASGAVPFPRPLAVPSPFPLAGRAGELAAALTHLESADGITMLWLAGEPGIGKTRLAAEIARRAHDQGADVLFGRCDEDVPASYQPFVMALAQWVTATPEPAAEGRLGRHPAELARLVPELAGPMPATPPVGHETSGVPEAARFRVYEAVRSWLLAAAADRMVLVVLDDLQWADPATVGCLAHLVRAGDPVRLRLVGTLRSTEKGGRSGRLRDLIDDLAGNPASATIALPNLAAADVAEMVEAVTGRASSWDPTGFASRVHAETAGNPLFVAAIVSGWTGAGDAVVDGRLPPDVSAAVRRRVSRLSGPAQELLCTAAVAGSEIDVRVMAHVVGGDTGATLDALEEAGRANLATETAPGRYRFAHGLVRRALRAEVSRSRAAHLHGLVADALEAVHAGHLDDHLDELAHHATEALPARGDPSRALHYLVAAGRRAEGQYASEAAAGLYRRAVGVIEAHPGTDRRRATEILLAFGTAQRLSGSFDEARATLRRAVTEAADGGWIDLQAEGALSFCRASIWPGLAGDESAGFLEAAVRALGESDPVLRLRVLTGLATALGHTPARSAEAAPLLDEAVALARRLGDGDTLAEVLAAAGRTLSGPRYAPRRLACATEAAELSRGRPRLRYEENHIRLHRLAALVETGALTEARVLLDGAGAHGPSDPFDTFGWKAAGSVTALAEARLAEAEARAEEARQIGEGLSGLDPEGVYGVQMFSIRREQGRLAEVAPVLRTIVRLGGGPATTWRPGLAALYAEVGLIDEARAELAVLVDTGQWPSGEDEIAVADDSRRGLCLSYLADAAVATGDSERAEVLYRALEPWAGLCIVMFTIACAGPADRFLGALATTAGRFDVAGAHLDAALAFSERAGSPTWTGYTRYHRARMLAARDRPGDREEARSLANRVREEATAFGLTALAQRAEDLSGI